MVLGLFSKSPEKSSKSGGNDSPTHSEHSGVSDLDKLLQSPPGSSNKPRGSPSPPSVRRMVSFTGIPPGTPPSPVADEEKSRGELLLKVQALKESLKEAELGISAERTVRKKKDKNLMKLAKELKKRNRKAEEDSEKFEEIEENLRKTQQELVLARKELEQQRLLSEKHLQDNRRDFERALAEAQNKYSKTCSEHDARITQITKAHATQCENLCKEILQSNVEADRLQAQLGPKKGILKRSSIPPEPISSRLKYFVNRLKTIFRRVIYGIILLAFAIYKDILPMGAICAPARPGMVLDDSNTGTVSYFAPWWAPASKKRDAFALLCDSGDRSHEPTRLDWVHDVYENKVIVTHGGKVALNKRGRVVEIRTTGVRLWNRRGQGEKHESLWR